MPKVKSRRCAHASAAHNLALSAPRRWKVPLPPRALPPHPTPIQNLRVTWSRKRCAALSMVSRAACCLCRARAAAPRAIRRLDQRRAKAAATKQQARATPEGPENAAHSSSCTMISHRGPLPGATEEESARADAAAKPGLDQPGIQRGRGAEGRGGEGRGGRRCLAAGQRRAARNGQGQAQRRGWGSSQILKHWARRRRRSRKAGTRFQGTPSESLA